MTRLFWGFSISFLVHLALFLPIGINSNPNPFQIESYPSSLEITLVSSRSTHEDTAEKISRILPLDEEISSKGQPAEVKEKVEKEAVQEEPVTLEPNPMAGAETETQMAPTIEKNPPPIYPEIARQLGYEGLVELRVQILEYGRVGKIEVLCSSGHDILDSAAREAIRRWVFMPARKGRKFVESSVVVPVRFQLKEMEPILIDAPDSNRQ